MEEIRIKALRKPNSEDLNSLLDWLCSVFDLELTQKDIFKELAKTSIRGRGITSKELNMKLSIPRSTIIYQLNRMIDYGFVIKKGRRYFLRNGSLKNTIEEMNEIIYRQIDYMLKIAEKIDNMVVYYGREKRRKY